MSQHIVLLGATGFIGGALLRHLEKLPQEKVRAHLLLHRASLARVPKFATVHRASIDAMPRGLLPAASHVIIHCASKQIDSDGSGYGINLRGIESLAHAVNAHTRAILFVSSYSIYGDGPQRGVSEDTPPSPQSALAHSRAECEMRLAELARTRRCDVAVFRTRFVLGPGDRFVLPGIARLWRSGLAVSGSRRYSIIDVDDFARILLVFAGRALESGAPAARFETFNVGYERPISMAEIVAVLSESLPAPKLRLRIPTNATLLELLARVPSARIRAFVQRLRLIGCDHYGSVAKLKARLDNDWLQTDPRDVVRRSVGSLLMDEQ